MVDHQPFKMVDTITTAGKKHKHSTLCCRRTGRRKKIFVARWGGKNHFSLHFHI